MIHGPIFNTTARVLPRRVHCSMRAARRQLTIFLSLFLPGPGDQLPVLLPERRGAVGHLGALGALEAGAGRGAGELLHSVLIPG